MTRTRWIWLSCGLPYLLFFSWYTSFGGPLTEREIDGFQLRTAEGAFAGSGC